jgi:RNA polymerase sigma-70 factor, ECF subfamily
VRGLAVQNELHIIANKMVIHDHAELLSDEALLHNIAHGCEECFDTLYARFHRPLLNLSKRILRDGHESEDVAQEVFLAIYEQRERFDPAVGPARTWILQFAYFKSLRRRRDLSKHHFRQRTIAADGDDNDPSLMRPEFIQRSVESKELVERALSSLSPGQRRVVEMLHFEGHTLREISQIEGKEFTGIRNSYYRGLYALRAILAKTVQHARPVEAKGREEYEIEL